MPRTARITIGNGCYHIITRGNQKQPVFLHEEDYQKYLLLLSKYKKRFQFKLYCFCLMPNHVHLLLQVAKPEFLQKIMCGLNLSYTRYFNFVYTKVGHLWQGRYKSKIIDRDEYFIECIKYIEANPVRADLSKNVSTYSWSSYGLRTKENPLLDDFALG